MKQVSKWMLLALLAFAQFMVVLDTSVVNVALPAIKQSLHFSENNLQWVITAYALTFGGFLLLGGRAADLFGRRRTLLTGMVGFTVFSLLIGLSASPTMLIVLRALQGIAAALMSPAALSIVLITFREGKDRNTALGVWSTVAAGGAAAGLLLGGALSQYLNWRWNFFVNVPIGIIVSSLIFRMVPVHAKEVDHNDLDLPGAVLVTGGLMGLVYSLSQAPVHGWLSGSTLGVGAAALALLAAFVFNESRSKHPLMPLSIFRIRNVVAANVMMAPLYAGMLGIFFLTSLYIQTVLHYSPVVTGLSFLPFPLMIATIANIVPKFIGKVGYKPFLIAGPALVGASLLWLTHLPVHGHYLTNLLPAFIVMPLGVGMTIVALTIAATSGVPAKESGLASGLMNTSQQMGGALGLAVLSGVAASASASASALGPVGALVHGDDRAFLVAVVFMAFVLVVALFGVKQRRKGAAGTHHTPVEVGV
ncbi:MAG TPA: MFS transporter [Candidatus Saccharimonadales bacterium]|nr:MFS transporter [Candidatus Saccharimonadales bacterium]